MDEKIKDALTLPILAGLIQGARYLRRRRGEEISIPAMTAAMMTAATVGLLVSVGLDFLGIDRRIIMIAVAVSGYLGGSLLETVADGVVATVKKYMHMDDKRE